MPRADAPAFHAAASAPRTAAAAPQGAESAAREAGPGARAAEAARSASAPVDPFDHLRERLAQTLGATPSGQGGKYVLRVSNRGESGDNVVSTAHADRLAASSKRKAAARAAGAGESPDAADAGAAGAAGGTGAAAPATAWDYTGLNGPDSWARLQRGFEQCGRGARQSPIDIRDGIAVELEPIRFDYRPGAFSVVDTGHTVRVDVAPGSAITLQGRRYELQEFHFHRPSEERIDGRQFDMSVHLVHKDAQGRVAVVAVPLVRGGAQPVVQAVWNNLPLEKNEAVQASGELDPSQLLPADRRYYTYMGSLTTPPCTEGVLWMVMMRPVQISNEQDAIFARLYPMNARPLQAASGRLIKESQ